MKCKNISFFFSTYKFNDIMSCPVNKIISKTAVRLHMWKILQKRFKNSDVHVLNSI